MTQYFFLIFLIPSFVLFFKLLQVHNLLNQPSIHRLTIVFRILQGLHEIVLLLYEFFVLTLVGLVVKVNTIALLFVYFLQTRLKALEKLVVLIGCRIITWHLLKISNWFSSIRNSVSFWESFFHYQFLLIFSHLFVLLTNC